MIRTFRAILFATVIATSLLAATSIATADTSAQPDIELAPPPPLDPLLDITWE